MPYAKIEDLPANVQKMPPKLAKQWMAVFNSVYDAEVKKTNDDMTAEHKAFQAANGVLKKRMTQSAVIRKFVTNLLVEALVESADPDASGVDSTGTSETPINKYYLSNKEGQNVALGDVTEAEATEIAQEAARQVDAELYLFRVTSVAPGTRSTGGNNGS